MLQIINSHIIATIYLLYSAIAIITYTVYANLSLETIYFHLFIIFVQIIFITSFGLIFLKANISIPKIYSLCWGISYLSISFVYLLSFTGFTLVGNPITLKIVYSYLSGLNNFLKASDISLAFTYSALVIAFCIYFGFFLFISNKIWRSLQNLNLCYNKFTMRKYNGTLMRTFFVALFILSLNFITDAFTFSNVNGRLFAANEPIYLIMSPKKIEGISLAGNKELRYVRSSYPKKLKFKRKNVVIIIVDALRSDYLSAYGYKEITSPFLNELVKSPYATKVDYAFSTASASFSGILSVLRSKLWTNLAQHNFAIHDLLKDQGYKTNFILSGDHTSFYLLKEAYGNSVDYYFDGSMSKKFYLNDDELLIEGLEGAPIANNNSNFFYFHLMSTHSLGIRKKEYQVFKPASALTSNPVNYQNNYKNGIIQSDKYIERLFQELEKKGILKNSLIIITGDHGESTGERGYFGHGNNVYNSEILIPLIIYDTDSTKKYNSDHAIQADVAPTIVDNLGIPIPKTWEGESLLRNHKNLYSYHYYKNSYAIIDYSNGEIIKYYYDRSSKQESVFNIRTDQNELKNIAGKVNISTLNDYRKMIKTYEEKTK